MVAYLFAAALIGQPAPPVPVKAGVAVAAFDPAGAVGAMNRERRRCGSPDLRADDRLMRVAKVRLDQLPDDGYSDALADGSDPLPPLAERFGFVGKLTQGSVVGGTVPAGLAVPAEQAAEPTFVPPPRTHHADMIDPRWTLVGFAAGVDRNGVACSMTVYGREADGHEGPPRVVPSRPRWVPLWTHPGWEAYGVVDEVARTVAVERWRYVGPITFRNPICP